ncbi:MAG: hypothetical protein V4494_03955 [Chlamydiota bacterium]
MPSFPLVVSYYTLDTLYQLEVQGLIASCEKWGIKHHIEGVASFGSWELNCGYKPLFILQKLMQFKQPILWVDADGVFVGKPEVIDAFSADLSVRIHEESSQDHISKVISSTVYVNWSEQGALLLRLWAEECYLQLNKEAREHEYWDQEGLRDVIFKGNHQAKVTPLPHSYAKIFDQKMLEEPVIEHFQASRRYKKIINTT